MTVTQNESGQWEAHAQRHLSLVLFVVVVVERD